MAEGVRGRNFRSLNERQVGNYLTMHSNSFRIFQELCRDIERAEPSDTGLVSID